MIVTLPVEKYPPVRGYLHHAIPLHILQNAENNLTEWYLYRYLQLVYDQEHEIKLNFYIPWFTFWDVFEVLEEVHLVNQVDYPVLENFLEKINHGYYIRVYVDEFFIRGTPAYGKYHYYHDELIYGYDLNKQEFLLYCYDNNQRYAETRETITHVIDSLNKSDWIHYLRAKSEYSNIKDREFALTQLLDYQNGTCTDTVFSEYMQYLSKAALYGTNVYDGFISEIETGKLDVRYFHILWEHKETLAKLADQFGDRQLAEHLYHVSEIALGLRDRIVKSELEHSMGINHKGRRLTSIVSTVNKIRDMERVPVDRLIDRLKASL